MEEKIGCFVYSVVALFILFAIVLGTSDKSKTTTSTKFHSSKPYNRHLNSYSNKKYTTNTYNINPSVGATPVKHNPRINSIVKESFKQGETTISREYVATYEKAKTPDDAESEGYDEGYYRGRRDKEDGYEYGENYDDCTSYYNYYETRYKQGYAKGYEDGYNSY